MTDYEYVGAELDVFALAANWKRYFAGLLQPYIRGEVLEVGAGIGETTRTLCNPSVKRWICVEPDPRLAARLANASFPTRIQPEIVVGDVTAVSIDLRFDTIVYIDVLEHIRDDRRQLEIAASKLAPGGFLVVLAPAFQQLFSEFDRAIGHERRYTRKSLEAVFPPNVRICRSFYADCVGAMLSLANRMLLRESVPSSSQILLWDRCVVPLSRVVDPIVNRLFGRSVIVIGTLAA